MTPRTRHRIGTVAVLVLSALVLGCEAPPPSRGGTFMTLIGDPKAAKLAADRGEADAQSVLGFMYRFGLNVPQDYSEAAKWYRLSADQGYALAQNGLGEMYAKGLGVSQDDEEAVKWFRAAADQHHPGGQNNLGLMYLKGEGVALDYAEAAAWFKKTVEQGNYEKVYWDAQANLENMVERGYISGEEADSP